MKTEEFCLSFLPYCTLILPSYLPKPKYKRVNWFSNEIYIIYMHMCMYLNMGLRHGNE